MRCQCTVRYGIRAGQLCGNDAKYTFKNVPVCGRHKNCKKLSSVTPVKKLKRKSKFAFNDLPDDIIEVICNTHLRNDDFRSLANFILTNKRNHEVCAGHLKELWKNIKYTKIRFRIPYVIIRGYLPKNLLESPYVEMEKMVRDFLFDPSVKTINGPAYSTWLVMTIGEEMLGYVALFEDTQLIGRIGYREPFLKRLMKPLSGYEIAFNTAARELIKLGVVGNWIAPERFVLS